MRLLLALPILLFFLENVCSWRTFWKGRRDGGNLIAPPINVSTDQLPPDQWFDQKLDHFTESNNGLWKQVNNNNQTKIKIYCVNIEI